VYTPKGTALKGQNGDEGFECVCLFSDTFQELHIAPHIKHNMDKSSYAKYFESGANIAQRRKYCRTYITKITAQF